MGHVDLAAHLDHVRRAVDSPGQPVDGPGVGGHDLAYGPVAARRRHGQRAVLVAQRERQPVDLRLCGQAQGLVAGKAEIAPDAGDELRHVPVGEGVREREHADGMPVLGEGPGGRGADAARRAVGADEFGESGLERGVPTLQRVIGRVVHQRRVVLVIGRIGLGEPGCERRELAPRGRLVQRLNLHLHPRPPRPLAPGLGSRPPTVQRSPALTGRGECRVWRRRGATASICRRYDASRRPATELRIGPRRGSATGAVLSSGIGHSPWGEPHV